MKYMNDMTRGKVTLDDWIGIIGDIVRERHNTQGDYLLAIVWAVEVNYQMTLVPFDTEEHMREKAEELKDIAVVLEKQGVLCSVLFYMTRCLLVANIGQAFRNLPRN